jgi:hypothetical protein
MNQTSRLVRQPNERLFPGLLPNLHRIVKGDHRTYRRSVIETVLQSLSLRELPYGSFSYLLRATGIPDSTLSEWR